MRALCHRQTPNVMNLMISWVNCVRRCKNYKHALKIKPTFSSLSLFPVTRNSLSLLFFLFLKTI